MKKLKQLPWLRIYDYGRYNDPAFAHPPRLLSGPSADLALSRNWHPMPANNEWSALTEGRRVEFKAKTNAS